MDLPVQIGDVLAGKYRVDRVIGAGGMGVVAAATHLQLEERVALKFLLPHAGATGEAVARFLREARAAVRIKNEHVARVMDVGTLENGLPFMVMELLDGHDLAAAVASGPLPAHEAVDYVLQACEAVAEAHALGIVHRDLKPSNLFLTTLHAAAPTGPYACRRRHRGAATPAASDKQSPSQNNHTHTKKERGDTRCLIDSTQDKRLAEANISFRRTGNAA
jgi:serine/threonine protein kinase